MNGTVWVAQFASASFDFVAVGRSEEEARGAMLAGAVAHARALGTGGVSSWFCADDVNVVQIPIGGCARDGRVIA